MFLECCDFYHAHKVRVPEWGITQQASTPFSNMRRGYKNNEGYKAGGGYDTLTAGYGVTSLNELTGIAIVHCDERAA